jgi:hypothetical protein
MSAFAPPPQDLDLDALVARAGRAGVRVFRTVRGELPVLLDASDTQVAQVPPPATGTTRRAATDALSITGASVFGGPDDV